MSPEEWAKAFSIMEDNGIRFHLILGNELFSYPDPVGLIRALKPFWGRYAVYSTFPPGWSKRLLDEIIDAGLYNMSAGVDVWAGLKTGDAHVDAKADAGLKGLLYCKQRSVPDLQATVTIHRFNYDRLIPLFDLISRHGIYIGCSTIQVSADGKHDFYGPVGPMDRWRIPGEHKGRFIREMRKIAQEARKGRWLLQVPPSYFEAVAELYESERVWHCSLPMILSVEEDGSLRGCAYRGTIKKRMSVFDLATEGAMELYVREQREVTSLCPGCSVDGGPWSYWWMAEFWTKGDIEVGDEVFRTHKLGHLFEETVGKR